MERKLVYVVGCEVVWLMFKNIRDLLKCKWNLKVNAIILKYLLKKWYDV